MEYRRVYDQGFRVPGPLFTAFCVARPETEGSRLGITVPRAVGKANIRNRIKRRLREAFRLHRDGFERAWDVVLNPRPAAFAADFAELERALEKVIQRCNSSS